MLRLTVNLVALLVTWSLASAQAPDSDYIERGPRFLLASTAAPVPVRVDVTRTPVLRQSISLDLNGVALGDALREISAKAGMQLAFSNTMLPAERTVTFRADRITVAAALTELLIDTQVDVLFSRDGRAVLVRRADLQGGTLSGRVTDAKTGKGIPNVSVYLEGTRWRTNTGEDGAYRLLDVTAGTYTVTASRIGYAKRSQSVTVAAGQEVTVEVRLEVSASPLDAVVVTGTLVPTEVKALPTPISIVTGEEIQRRGYQRVDQIFRGDIPGATGWDEGPARDYFSVVSVRGVSTLSANPTIKTYIDGVEVADPQFIATIDPNSIDRIEITRGPQASTLYGAGALDGVMQIFTKKGRLGLSRPEVSGTVSAGTIGGWGGSTAAFQTDNTVSVVGGGDRTSYHVSGSYRHIGEWAPSYASTDRNAAVGWETTQGLLTLSASARYSDKTFDYPWDTRLESYVPFSKPPYESDRLRQQTYGATASFQATEAWSHTLTLGYDQAYYDLYQTQPSFTTPADSFLHTYAEHESKTSVLYHTDLSVRLGTVSLVTISSGVNYQSFDYVDSYTGGATRTTGTLDGSTTVTRAPWTNTGYFGQVQINVAERLFLTGGLRAERNANFGPDVGTAWSPRTGVSYVFGLAPASVKLRASYGESIRVPGPVDREAFQSPFYIRLANPALGPERQRGWDGGLEVYTSGASLGITYYNQRAINLIQLVTVPRPPGDTLPAYQNQNIARVKNDGWEFEGRVLLGPVRVVGTYSIMASTVEQLGLGYQGNYQVGDKVFDAPGSLAGLTVTYAPRPHTSLTGTMTYIGHWTDYDVLALYGFFFGGQQFRGSFRAYQIQYPAVTKFGVGASQDLTDNVTALIRVENVGNSLRYERFNLNLPSPRRVLVGARIH
jgi:outer membrane receptor protein involved in Fe transport